MGKGLKSSIIVVGYNGHVVAILIMALNFLHRGVRYYSYGH